MSSEKRTVPAQNFCETLAANVDNEKMDDAAFREFVRNTLPIVQFPQPCSCGRTSGRHSRSCESLRAW